MPVTSQLVHGQFERDSWHETLFRLCDVIITSGMLDNLCDRTGRSRMRGMLFFKCAALSKFWHYLISLCVVIQNLRSISASFTGWKLSGAFSYFIWPELSYGLGLCPMWHGLYNHVGCSGCSLQTLTLTYVPQKVVFAPTLAINVHPKMSLSTC